MFEVFSEDRRPAPHRSSIPLLVSTTAHVLVVCVLLAIPVLYVSTELPDVPQILTFVVTAAPPPPPPPPAPVAAPSRATPAPSKAKAIAHVRETVSPSAPVEAPRGISEVTHVAVEGAESIPYGVDGGLLNGIVGGVGVSNFEPPPPPPPSTAVARQPVRIGGAIKSPELLERVEPEYPPLAVRAQVQGVVILEALVDRQGHVEQVRVLRSIPLLDRAAIAAVRQWRYSPLMLNGNPERFVLTVTLSFSLSA